MRSNCPIAIVGLGGVFPRATTPAALWDNVLNGVNAVRDVPPGRWILDPADVLGDGVRPDTVRHGHQDMERLPAEEAAGRVRKKGGS